MNVLGAGYQWFWWAAPILMVATILFVFFVAGGYVRKVVVPRAKGRRVVE